MNYTANFILEKKSGDSLAQSTLQYFFSSLPLYPLSFLFPTLLTPSFVQVSLTLFSYRFCNHFLSLRFERGDSRQTILCNGKERKKKEKSTKT